MENYPWFQNYPAGISHEINAEKYSSLVEFFEDAVNQYKDLTAYVNMGKEMTFRQLDIESDKFAAYLQNQAGLSKGDRIAIQMPNLLQFPVALFGSIKAGLTVVNTNPLYTPREMAHQFKDSGAKAVVILANFAHNLEKIIKDTDIELVIITEIGDMMPGLKRHLVNFVVKKVKKMVPSFHLPQAVKFNDLMSKGAGQTYQKVEIDANDVAFLQYTGGTTGVSKGAMLTHRNMIGNMVQSCEWMTSNLQTGKETIVTAIPLYHIFALTVNCFTFMSIGAKNILITNPRDMKSFIGDLKKYPFSVLTGVNTLFNGLLNQADFANVDFSHLKVTVGGGMAVQEFVAKKWESVTGCPLSEGYGLTETSPVACCNPIGQKPRMGSIGLPLPSTEIKLIDENNQEVAPGEIGELCIKGPQVMKGYWLRPEETAKVMLIDWLKTGDMAKMDDDGYFRIVDRKKEMINVSGFNVYPNEVENVISLMEEVLEVGVIGVPDEHSTEVVKAFVVKKDPSLNEEKIIAFCKENLTGYKVPKLIEFRGELPKSNVGKIIRRLLVEKVEEEPQPKV